MTFTHLAKKFLSKALNFPFLDRLTALFYTLPCSIDRIEIVMTMDSPSPRPLPQLGERGRVRGPLIKRRKCSTLLAIRRNAE